MSILEAPRILFRGNIAWDPITTNNDNTLYDEDTDRPIWPAESKQIVETAAERVAAYRQKAIDMVTAGGLWNPHGTHRSTFFDTRVVAVDAGSGLDQNDACVRSDVTLQGMLVDLEPYGAFTSQLFFDVMQFGVQGGYRVLCPRTNRVTDRYLNFVRNPSITMIAGGMSVVWQTSFAKADGLRVDAFDSVAFNALARALDEDDVLGLTVRFNTYDTVYFDDPDLAHKSPEVAAAEQALAARLARGGFQPNPARSRLVGCLGLWRRGEPAHEPGDRALLPPASGSPLGTAFARFSERELALDFANTVPESDHAMTKQDLGDLSVVGVNAGSGVVVPLGTLRYGDYEKAAYETGGGIVTLELPGDVAANDGLDVQVRQADGTPLLVEAPLRMLPVVPNQYVDEGQIATVAFQAYYRGQPAAGERSVVVYALDSDGDVVGTRTVATDQAGVARFAVPAMTPGVVAFVPVIAGSGGAPVGGITPLVDTYSYLRTLATDDHLADVEPTWENVYRYVLSEWNALAPCMDNYLLLNDPDRVAAAAGVLRRLTDPAQFESFMFMPVTRDMTVGERGLLYRFLDTANAAAGGRSGHGGRAASRAEGGQERMTETELCGATRRPREFDR